MEQTTLKRILRERGLKHGWVAEKAGVSLAAFSALANGKTKPTLKNAQAIARVLGLEIDEIWPEENKNHYPSRKDSDL